MPIQDICTRNASSWRIGSSCDSCGHTGMVHCGIHNPGLEACVICMLLTYVPASGVAQMQHLPELDDQIWT